MNDPRNNHHHKKVRGSQPRFDRNLLHEAQKRLYEKSTRSPNAVNDKILIMEKKIINKFSKHILKFGMAVAIVIPPYILYWKDKQMEVSFFP